MNEKKKIRSVLDHLRVNASEKDVAKINKRLGGMKRGPLRKVWGQVLLLWRLVRDKDAPWFSKATAIAGLLYVIIPFDVIPDMIPFLGLTDDVAAVTMAIAYLGVAVNKYRNSRKAKNSFIN